MHLVGYLYEDYHDALSLEQKLPRLVFITEVESVYCAVRTESLYITQIRFVFKGFKRKWRVFTARYALNPYT
jgi:hypothetical protein